MEKVGLLANNQVSRILVHFACHRCAEEGEEEKVCTQWPEKPAFANNFIVHWLQDNLGLLWVMFGCSG